MLTGAPQKIIARAAEVTKLPPQLVAFGIVGCVGLSSDIVAFTACHNLGNNPFVSRVISLAFATLVTWTLNRHFTFEPPDRAVSNEASRYIVVTLCAQGVSYMTFAILVLTMPAVMPQIFMVVGAVTAAAFSFLGHKFFSFGPKAQRA
jgi:putative flippase GtrA